MTATTTTAMKIGMTFPSRLACFDLETTSPIPTEARIVTAFIGVMLTETGEWEESWEWIVDPGVDIPLEASNIHGITTARARAEGMDAAKACMEITQRLEILWKRSLAIVAFNAAYDFTVLDRELLRHHPKARPLMRPNAEGKILQPVAFDPSVFDRAVSKRAGKRTLVDCCRFYGIPVEDNAHDAGADCLMTGRLAIELLKHSRLADLSLSEVHEKLIPTKRKNNAGLVEFWRTTAMRRAKTEAERAELRRRIAEASATGHFWPMIPRETETP